MTRLFNIILWISIFLHYASCGKFSPKKREETEPGNSDIFVPAEWDGLSDYNGGNWKISE